MAESLLYGSKSTIDFRKKHKQYLREYNQHNQHNHNHNQKAS